MPKKLNINKMIDYSTRYVNIAIQITITSILVDTTVVKLGENYATDAELQYWENALY